MKKIPLMLILVNKALEIRFIELLPPLSDFLSLLSDQLVVVYVPIFLEIFSAVASFEVFK